MDDIPNQTQAPADVADLQEQFDSLHHLVISILVLLIVVSGTLWIYLRRQVNATKAELESIRPQATNIIAQYDKVTGPSMDNFVGRLVEYSRSHPDFVPVLAKYGVKPGAAAAAPTSAPPPTTKK
ncbi:MAG TPA: hypothetical protein VN578_00875 [Candidatus Binatia bacterium]|nr:hypothetical protein [Candidatus Binatia bacterium]